MTEMHWYNWAEIIGGMLLFVGGMYGNYKLSQWEKRRIAQWKREAQEKYEAKAKS